VLVSGLDGIEYEWKYHAYKNQSDNSSSLHVRARNLLKTIYPFAAISEEIPLIGTLKEKLILDLYIHTQNLAIEVQGEQHFKFNTFFFKNKQAFSKAQARDRSKVEWCKLNNIDLVTLPYDESDKQWEARIRRRGFYGEVG